METKQQKAENYAREAWGIYADDTFDQTEAQITMTLGEITQSDYIAGYDQAIEDTHFKDMLNTLKQIQKEYELGIVSGIDSLSLRRLIGKVEQL